MIQLPKDIHWSTCAILNSDTFVGLLHLLMARGVGGGQTLKYEVGYVGTVPIPEMDQQSHAELAEHAIASYKLIRTLFTTRETSHVFTMPAIVQVTGDSLAARATTWLAGIGQAQHELEFRQNKINNIVFRLYGIEGDDRRSIEAMVASHAFCEEVSKPESEEDDDSDADGPDTTTTPVDLVADIHCYAVGCVFGRWDVRLAMEERGVPDLRDPFDPLPACSPGMLQNEQVHPLTKDDMHRLQATGECRYPLDIPWDGILVDDPGHPLDIEARVEQVLQVI